MSDKQVQVNWRKWNWLRFKENAKCFFGFHSWVEHGGFNQKGEFTVKWRGCSDCGKEEDFL